MNAITTTNGNTWEIMRQQAKILVDSGFLPQSVNTPQKALAIMTMAKELQIGMWAGFNGIHVIRGKPTISPQLMLALINRSGECDALIIEGDDKQCSVTMGRKGRNQHTEIFTMDNAKSMGLAANDNWTKQPAVMLKWRAVSACARVVFPDVIIGFYTPEEINPDLEVDAETGEIIKDNGKLSEPVAEIPAEAPQPSQEAVDGEVVEDKPETAPSEAQADEGEPTITVYKRPPDPMPIKMLIAWFAKRVADCDTPHADKELTKADRVSLGMMLSRYFPDKDQRHNFQFVMSGFTEISDGMTYAAKLAFDAWNSEPEAAKAEAEAFLALEPDKLAELVAA